MPSQLSAVPTAKRRQLAATLGLFAVLFLAIAAVAATNPRNGTIKVFIGVALVFAAVLALMGWGLLSSVRTDVADKQVDDEIARTVAASGASLCDCGHEHDPTELHVVDDPCEHDGAGVACTHTCDTCVLASLRPTKAAQVAAAAAAATPRPSPRPRPSPTPR